MTFLKRQDDPKGERLLAIPLFASADKQALQHLESAVDEVDVKAGTVLYTQGHRHAEGYVLVSGTLSVTIDGEEVAEISGLEVIGEVALFGHSTASATVTAKSDASLLVIPYNRFDQILDDNPGFTKAIAKQLAARLNAMDARLQR